MAKDGPKVGEKKRFQLPHIFVILFVIIVICTILTWIIPAGSYVRTLDEASGKMIIDPASFAYTERTPVDPFEMFVCIEKGLIEAANISFMIFAAFSAMYVLEKTGSIDAAIAWMEEHGDEEIPD